MGFPFEIITMLASTVLGGLMSVWAESRKAKAENEKLLITRGEFNLKAVKQARDHGLKDKGFAWTRRIIALSSVFAIVIFPKLVAVYYPDVTVTVGYTEWNPGFLFFKEGPRIGRKSGSVGLKPSHSSSCLPRSGKSSFAHLII